MPDHLKDDFLSLASHELRSPLTAILGNVQLLQHHLKRQTDGLYITHEIVTQHGGKIWLESKPGKGSTFYFSMLLTRMSDTPLVLTMPVERTRLFQPLPVLPDS